MKKIILMVLAVATVVGAYADRWEDPITGIPWTYTVINGNVSLGGGSAGSAAVPSCIAGNIVIPSVLGGYPVTSIGKYAFQGRDRITNVTIPEGVVKIDSYAFDGCDGLVSVVVPDSVVDIGECAFQYCRDIVGVTIGAGLKNLGEGAFNGCVSLMSFEVSEVNVSFCSINGSLLTKDGKILVRGVNGNAIIPDGVKNVANYAFYGSDYFYRMDKEHSGSGVYIFVRDNRGLKSVIIPNGVTNIGERAFQYCHLTSVTIPESVRNIDSYAFYCRSQPRVVFMGNAPVVGHDVFTGICAVGKSSTGWGVDIPGTWNGVQIEYYEPPSLTINNGVLTKVVLNGCSEIDIPYGVTGIGNWAFGYCLGLTSVRIPDSVTSIGAEAFRCTGLTNVTIPGSVTSIGAEAFYGCSGLTSVTIPASVTSIGSYAFYGTALSGTVVIPASVEIIGEWAFNPEGADFDTRGEASDSAPKIAEFRFLGACPAMTRWIQFARGYRDGASGANWYYHYYPKGAISIYPWFAESFPSSFSYVSVDKNGAAFGEGQYSPIVYTNLDAQITSSPRDMEIQTGRFDIVLESPHPSVNVRYTTDGSDPALGGVWYTQKFAARGKTTVRAIGYYNGKVCTAPATFRYGAERIGSPVISISPGNAFYHRGAVVSITCPTDGATIRYTIDGSTPSATNGVVYVSPFTIDETTTVKAIAVNHASYFDSDIACQRLERVYVPVEDPVISSDSGSSFSGEYCTVSIACATEGATIYYTTDGASPKTAGKIYTGPFKVYESATVRACATKDDYADSAIASFGISNVQPFAPTPQICLKGGGLNASGGNRTVRIWTDETVDAIYYTLDGTTPTEASARYTSPFLVDATVTIKAFSRKNAHRNSAVVSATITYSRGMGDALGCPDLPWIATDVDWREIQSGHAGTTGVQSTAIGDGDTTEISTTVFGPGDISFWWKTSCQYDNLGEYYYDHAEFWIDGMCIAMLDGESDWVKVEHSIVGTGSHTIAWRYVKDGDVSVGSDCLWLSDMRWSGKDMSVVEITFNANGGTVSPTTQIVISGGTIGELPIPTRAQRVFAGWWTAVDGGTQISASTIVTDVATYYAHWILNQYAVTFDANGGMGGTSGKQDYGTAITAPTVTREGYTFVGWSPNVATTVPAHDVTYTAQWTPIVDPLPELPGNVTGVQIADALEGSADTNLAVHVTDAAMYNAYRAWADRRGLNHRAVKDAPRAWLSFALDADKLITKHLERGDVEIVTFSPRADGLFGFEVSVKDINLGPNALSTNLARVFGVEGAASLTDGAFSYENVEVSFEAPVDGRLRFAARPLVTDGSSFMRVTMADVYGDVVNSGVEPVKVVTVTFNANGGVGGRTTTQECGTTLTAPTVTRDGYTFTDWTPAVAATVPASNVTYVAQWGINQYTVAFNANGGVGGATTIQDYGTAITAPTVTRDGYTFTGWSPAVAATVPTSNVTYVAQWEENVPHEGATTWHVNGSTGYDSNSGTNASSAKATIQAAIDASGAGDTILVAAGTYAPITTGNKAITIKSTEGAESTIIDGGNGNPCVVVLDTNSTGGIYTNTVVSGFTLRNGRSSTDGGCAKGGTYHNCIIQNGQAFPGSGGGAAYAALENCLVVGGYGMNGGNLLGCIARNCTLLDGSARDNGSAFFFCAVYNSIYQGTSYCFDPPADGFFALSHECQQENVYNGDPGFVDATNGDYRLAAGSPCIDAGDNSYVTSDKDLAGNARIANNTVDIGCYEYHAHHKKVQLWEGGPYWAETNIGADEPEDYGYYFWWGDTVGYERVNNAWVATDGSSSNFSFGSGNTPTYNKSIATLQSEGWITSDSMLVPEHDAAHVHWGGKWRMPTKQEQDDLRSKCDWTWTKMRGVNGYVVRGKGDYASNSIFLPAAGEGVGTSLSAVGWFGIYWSSVPFSDSNYDDYFAWGLYFDSSTHDAYDGHYRDHGRSVRPVQDPVQNVDTYMVTYCPGVNGSGEQQTTTKTHGVALALNGATFTRSGYTQTGWSTSDGGAKTYDLGASYTADAPVTLYPFWTANDPGSGDLGGVQLWEGGPYWAECNVGATKPEEYGYYFWWGDTVGYTNTGSGWISVKDGASISFDDSGAAGSTYSKNNSALQSAGYIDSTGNLVAAHDAATAHLGAPWRMPTDAEFSALIDNCTSTWITTNGVSGRLVTGKGEYANRSIFLPAAGFGYGSSLYGPGSYGYYWSSTPDSGNFNSYYAWYLHFNSGSFRRDSNDRHGGRSVRPVRGFAE